MTKKNKMLPSGFGDLLFEEAKQDYYIRNLLTGNFLENGFNIIKTPLLEFRDNFSPDQVNNNFSTIDIASGNNLVLRNDITLQIERLLETRLKDAELPLKLCYEGDVFLAKNDKLYADRQLTQSGFEIIGCQENDYLQIIENSVDLMSKLVARKLILEVSIPNFAKILCDSLDIDCSEDLQLAIQKKSLSKINEILGGDKPVILSAAKNLNQQGDCSLGSIIRDVLVNFTDLDYVAQKIATISSDQRVLSALSRLFLVRDLIERNCPNVEISFDVFGDDFNSYHQDIAFKIFCEGHAYSLLKGGKYKICDLDSVGATFYVNQIRKLG